jgi:hypothetical protein
MLFGTRKVSVASVASINSTAENQRLKVSALTCGFKAAVNRCQSSAHFSFIELVNSVTQLPQSPSPRENHRCDARDSYSTPIWRWKKNPAEKARNTREKCVSSDSMRARPPQDRHLSRGKFRDRLSRHSWSWWASIKSCSHVINIYSLFALPKGLRLEIGLQIDKKKTEFYF